MERKPFDDNFGMARTFFKVSSQEFTDDTLILDDKIFMKIIKLTEEAITNVDKIHLSNEVFCVVDVEITNTFPYFISSTGLSTKTLVTITSVRTLENLLMYSI